MVSKAIDSISYHTTISSDVRLKISPERMSGECNGCLRYPIRPGFMLHVPASMIRGKILSAKSDAKFLVKSHGVELSLTCEQLASKYPVLSIAK